MKKIEKIILLSFFAFLLAENIYAKTLKELVSSITGDLFQKLAVLLIGLAVLYTFWSGFQLVQSSRGGNEKDLTKHKMKLVWAIVALSVIVSFWGLVNLIVKTFNLDRNDQISIEMSDWDYQANQYLNSYKDDGDYWGD